MANFFSILAESIRPKQFPHISLLFVGAMSIICTRFRDDGDRRFATNRIVVQFTRNQARCSGWPFRRSARIWPKAGLVCCLAALYVGGCSFMGTTGR